MGLQGMRSNTGIISPNLVQQRVTWHDTLGGAIKKFENIGFFFRQANFLIVPCQQHFDRRFERIRPKCEDSIFGLFMLAQLGADAGQQDRKFERLGDVVIGPGIQSQNRIRIGVVTGKHQDWAFHALLADQTAQLAAINIRQTYVQNDHIVGLLFYLLQSFRAVPNFENVEIFRYDQQFAQRFAQIYIIVDQKNFFSLGHCGSPSLLVIYICALARCIASFATLASHLLVIDAGIVSIPLQKEVTEVS